jgi:hypothetical protein
MVKSNAKKSSVIDSTAWNMLIKHAVMLNTVENQRKQTAKCQTSTYMNASDHLVECQQSLSVEPFFYCNVAFLDELCSSGELLA